MGIDVVLIGVIHKQGNILLSILKTKQSWENKL